jgi:ligand-binding SRPBCC domain-containing protein
VPAYSRKQYQLYIAHPRPAVFAYLADVRHHTRLHPTETLLGEPTPRLAQGVQQTVTFDIGGRMVTQTRQVTQWVEDERIVWMQLVGPYTYWKHQCLLDIFQEGTLMTDSIEFTPPGGLLKRLTENLYEQSIETLLQKRQQEAKRILEFMGRIKGKEAKPDEVQEEVQEEVKIEFRIL